LGTQAKTHKGQFMVRKECETYREVPVLKRGTDEHRREALKKTKEREK